MKRIAIFLILTLIFGVFSPVLPFLRDEKTYSYASESFSLPLESREIYAPSASLEALPKKVSLYSYTGSVTLSSPKGSFTIEIPRSAKLDQMEPEALRVIWKTASGDMLISEFDEVGERDIRPSLWSDAAVFEPTLSISYEILSPVKFENAPRLSAVDVRSYATHLTVDTGTDEASADVNAFSIVPRSSWGADETVRYQDSATWKNYYANLEKTKNDPISAAQKKAQERLNSMDFYLATNYPEMYESAQTIREESWHKLVWPIERTKNVKKIVIHHTAENNLKDLSDEELIRSTYYYHAVNRGWGDIGYNYIVGQRGQVYEGRAWGDYSVGAHAAWNNKSTVGVSVIGNFEKDTVNLDQENGIKAIIKHLSMKYGIDLSGTSPSHKECIGSKADSCLFEDSMTPNLVGHRDVGYTACPGKNLYEKLPAFRTDAKYSLGLTYVTNPISVKVAANGSTPSSPLSNWPDIRVLLSYKNQSSVTIEGNSAAPKVMFGKIGGTLKKNIPLKLEASGSNLTLRLGAKRYKVGKEAIFTSDVLKVSSWSRKPTWDTSGTMNDNLFRGTLRVRAVAGKIELVNILPIELYLKGLAEISNNDPEEKVKTILVAARSYAYFYSQQKNRKFPGKDYDASDDPDVFQKYLGYGYEKRSSRIAGLVDETRGLGVSYNGEFIKPWYFSESDGRTRSYKEYCESNGGKTCANIPYLTSVDDPGGAGHTRKWHGVGISGIWATYFANVGWKYDAIIAYYLVNTKVQSIY